MMTRLMCLLALALLVACDDDSGVDPVPFPDGGAGSSGEAGSGGAAGGAGEAGAGGEAGSGGVTPDPLPARIDLDNQELFPEGVAFDPEERVFYVGSLADGAVAKVSLAGATTIFAEPPDGAWQTYGIKVDADRRRLWVCAAQDLGMPTKPGFVWAFDLSGGEALARHALADAADGATCNDVALDHDGAAYLTDPRAGRLYKATVEGVEVLVSDPALDPSLPGLGFNGLALTPDGAGLVVGVYKPTTLHYVPLDAPAFTPIALSGAPLEGQSPMAGADGLAFVGADLFVVFDGEVFKLVMDGVASGAAERLTHPDVSAGLSTATVADGSLYVLKGEVMAFVTSQTPDLPFSIVRWPL